MPNTEEIGKQASIDGFAHEHIVVGFLMKRYQNVSLVDLPLSPYDIIIVRKLESGKENIIRAQVKTARSSISFTGGTRGGVDREYKSDIKTYTQSPETSDVIIGFRPNEDGSFDMFFVPTCLISIFGTKSKGLGKIEFFKNNFDILENCKDFKYCTRIAKSHGLI
ncbi:MAG: hypothetical protein WC879_17280 [Melioribacteraceae bacterium]